MRRWKVVGCSFNVNFMSKLSIKLTKTTKHTFTLTTGVDSIVGGAGNDTINAIIDGTTGAVATTMTTLDSVDGGAGNDTLALNVINGSGAAGSAVGALPVITVKNIETANVRSAVGLTADTTAWTGLTSLNVTQGAAVALTAATTTAVSVAGATGAIGIDGGSSATVTATTAAQGVTIGATTVGAGAVTVTHTNQTTGNIAIDGGTTVAVTASKATSGTVSVGQGGAVDGSDQPSGAITVTTTGAAYAAADSAATRGAIQTTGGTTVTVTQTATSSTAAAATDTTNANNGVTQSAVTVTGGKSTTAVTVSQSAAVTAVDAVAAVAGVKQVDTVTFIALAATESVTVGGLTFTAAKALTAAEVAAAFANLSAGATHGAAPAANGIYSGTFGTYTTGAVTTANSASTVDATASTAATGNTVITFSDTSAANIAAANKTAGVTAVTGVTGKMGVAGGVVQVIDYGYADAAKADSITTATLDGYAASSFVKSDALATLSLANSAGSFAAWNNTATTLGLTLNKVTGTVSVDAGTAKYNTLNITATGTKSATALTAAAVTALTVSGDTSLDLTNSTLSALKTVTVTGAAGLTVNASGSTVTAVNTTGTTGKVTATVDASKATYTGGAGVDAVTLSNGTVSKAVNTGAGDDSVTLAAGAPTMTANVSGGEGSDTLVMAAADAVTVSASDTFETKIDGFEKLSLGQAASAVSVNLANIDDINYVVSAGGVAAVPGVAELQLWSVGESTLAAGTTVTFNIAGTSYPVTVPNGGYGSTAAITAGLASLLTATAANTQYQIAQSNNTSEIFFIQRAGYESNIADITATGVTLTNANTGWNGAAAIPAGTLTLTNMANNGTLELTAAATTTTVTMTDATGTADSFNVVTKVDAANVDFGSVAVAGVETVNLTVTDTTPVNETTGAATISKATLTVTDAAAKAIVVSGNSDLDLTAAGTALTSVNASALTGKLSFSTAVTGAEITGGSAADTLTATGSGQKLNGGSGADTLVVTGDLAVLTGGAGNDVFNVADATTNVNSYATITDLASGDAIKFGAVAAKFLPAKVTLGDTAVFQDLANAAIANGSQGDVAWFQYGGNTFVVEHAQAGGVTFLNNTDVIVKITGLVDLSTASFSSDADTLYIA